MKNKILLVIVFLFLIVSNNQAQQIDIDVRVSPPYQLNLDGLTNQLLATVRNTSLEAPANNINFRLELYGPKGLRISSNRIFDEDIDLEPGEVRQFIGNDWDALYESTNLSIEPIQEKQRMLNTQSLRDGSYKICITAFSTITNERLSKGVPSDCDDFIVEEPNAPEIIFPRNNYTIPQDGSPLNITWQQLNVKTSPTYMVEIVDLTRFPNIYSMEVEGFNYAEKIYQEGDIHAFQHTVEDVDWEVGHQYAVRVTAISGTNEGTLYENKLHSKQVKIMYEGNAIADDDKEVKDTPVPTPKDDDKEEAIVDTNAMDVKPHYPIAGDTIPFLEFPLVVKFSPESDKIKRMEFTARFKNKIDKTDKLTWKKGAKKFLNREFLNANWQQASLIPLLDITNTDKLKRGEQYHWSSDVALFKKATGGKKNPFIISLQNFVVGMPKPVHQSPKNNDTIAAGDIKFEWKTANDLSSNIVPDFKLFHIDKSTKIRTPLGNVHEKWVLQVFNKEKSTKKEDRVQQLSGVLDVNPNEFLNQDTRKFDKVRLKAILFSSLNHTFNITEKGTYWWRIVWLKNPDMKAPDIKSLKEDQIYHASSFHSFTIEEGDESVTDNTPTTDGDCKSNCVTPDPSKKGTIVLKVGDTPKIGKFNLTVNSITKSNNKTYTGTGLIEITFLNNIKVKVDFTDIKINAQSQIYVGTVKAKQDKKFITREDKIVDGLKMLGMSKADAKSLDDAISDGTKAVYEMTSGSETTLPLGWDFEIDGHRVRLAVMDIDFKSTTAAMDAMALADIPIVSDDGTKFKETISFGAKDVCFNPGGLGDNFKLYVPEDIELNPTDQNVFAVRGYKQVRADQTRKENDYTYLKWGCDGFEELNVALQLKFSREVIIPEDKKGKPAKIGNVIGVTNFNLKREAKKFNFLAEIKFSSPFQLPNENAYGWGFEVNHVWLDLSTVENPPNIKFPKNYQFSTNDNRLANTWKGLWIDKMAIKAPHYIETAQTDKKKVLLETTNFIIDPKVSFQFLAKDIVPLSDKAKVDGNHISIDSLYLDILQNNFKKAGFTGRLALVIAEDKPSQMFKYNVLMDNAKSKDGSTNLGLVFSAKPEKDDIEILSKGLMMKGKLAKTSFIELGVRGKAFTKFKLDGEFGFSTDFDDNKDKRTFTLKMLGVKIEGLSYDSSKPEPFTCNDCLKTTLASPQKTLSGFPVTLKSINMGTNEGNPMLSIEPKIDLMGKDAGFSLSTKLNITAKLAKVNNSWDFSIEDVKLERVELEPGTKLGGLTVEGFLEFYKDKEKKGTRGALTVMLPGDIGGMMSADFGVVKQKNAKPNDFDKNKNWYSYWYVDGTVLLGQTGIPMGAVNMYGLGGGASHHMKLNNLPKGSTLATAVAKQIKSADKNEVTTSSGAKYIPDFNTGLGIKFTSILGSPGGGKVYNFDVTLSGEFNNTGGLHKLGLEGNARILPNKENPFTGKAPMQAYVNFGVENFEDKEKLLITGNLIVNLNMRDGILKGIGKASNRIPASYQGPKDNILVEAAFLSDKSKDEWYFIMGKPKESERAGISVGITLYGERHEIAKTTGYFLAGNALDKQGIDLGIPSPTQAFLAIQAKAQGNENLRANTELKKDNSIASAVSDPKSVQGFQFGAAMDVRLEGGKLFYYDLGMAIGFDLLMKNVEQCAGSKTGQLYSPPGDNGWYSEGQFYAGINGEFGLKVDLYFIQGRYTILKAAAALMLQGNFPNPDGFRGEGDIAYSILGGLIEGNHHFNLKSGEQCAAYTNPADALDNLNIIQDLKPSGGKDKSVFATCAASFGIALNKDFEIPVSGSEIKVVRPYLESWTLKEKNGAIIPGTIRMENNNFAATLERDKMLKGKRRYTQTIRVMANEIINGSEVPIKNKEKTANWYNERKENFTTGESPDVIAEENVRFTYPLKNQKHFLKGETFSNRGYVVLNQAQNEDKKVFDKSANRDFIARFIKIDGANSSIETPIRLTHKDKSVEFDVSKLENNQVYLVQLLSKKIAPPQSTNQNPVSTDNITSVKNRNQGVTSFPKDVPLPQAIKLIEGKVNLFEGKSTVNVKERKLPDNLVIDPTEKILYKFYFKTSKYNTFKEKISGVNWSNKFNTSPSLRGEYATFSSSWNELPEAYDKTGASYKNYKVSSLIDVTINNKQRYSEYPENNYTKKTTGMMLNPYHNLKNKVLKYGLKVNEVELDNFSKGVYFSEESTFDNALSKNEVETAFETQQRKESFLQEKAKEAEALTSYNSNPQITHTPSNQNVTTYSATTYTQPPANSTSSGYIYTTYFVAQAYQAPEVQITHKLPNIAWSNLRKIRKAFRLTIGNSLELWSVSRNNCYSLKSSRNSNHYISKYRKRYSKNKLYKYLVNKPVGGDFLRTFDRETRRGIERFNRIVPLLRYSRYEDNDKLVRNGISFILQYQYPTPTNKSYKNSRMRKGTHVRISN